jgi:pimeloyl-ACP methyl ester carboxylesterase
VTPSGPAAAKFQSVRPSVRTIAALLLTASAWASAFGGAAQAQIAFTACGDSNNFACGHLAVPLDPSGAVAGMLTLAMRRHRAPIESSGSAVIALAGGPGQAAIPLTESFLELVGPLTGKRDLIVFDQRGTGLSHALSCPSGRRARTSPTPAQMTLRCATSLGKGRAFYTTADSVADIEAIRRAGGYERLVLYGTSYGTKVAEQYAQDYPAHVEALVLDSVVTPNGPDPLSRSTFAAIPRILDQLCGHGECAHITQAPVSDLARALRRMARGDLSGAVIDGHGRSHPRSINSQDLLGILLEGDFDPLLRAEFVPAVRAAAEGDTAELARLLARAELHSEEPAGAGIDGPLYLTTTCEEELFPWDRAATAGGRLQEAAVSLRALPASAFSPFTAADALGLSSVEVCAFWPYSTPVPPLQLAPLPNVPTLLLSGETDLRTPTSDARAVASQIPDSHLLVVPYAGHSVLSNEPTTCASDALRAMFAGRAVRACRTTAPPAGLKLPPLPPRRIAGLTPARGSSGLPGRTLRAVGLTLADFSRQLVLALLEALGSGGPSKAPSLRGGGLRAGWYQLRGSTILLHGYSYLPGVAISGRVSPGHVDIVVGGSAGAHGTLHSDGRRGLLGTLGAEHVRLAPGASSIPAAPAAALAGARARTDGRTLRLLAPLRGALAQLPPGSIPLTELSFLLSAGRARVPRTAH